MSVLKINVAGPEPAVLDGAILFLAAGGADVLVLLIGPESFSMPTEIEIMGHPASSIIFAKTSSRG